MSRRPLVRLSACVIICSAMSYSQAYVLEFVSYDGSVSASATVGGTTVFHQGPYQINAVQSVVNVGEASGWGLNFDLSSHGGRGPGDFEIGGSYATGSGDAGCSGFGSASATYTWRLLSEYGNTGAVTLSLSGDGGYSTPTITSHGPGSSDLNVASSLDSHHFEFIESSPGSATLDETVAFLVPIGGTFTVTSSATGSGGGDHLCLGGGHVDAFISIPAESIPEPVSIVILALGGLFLRQRRCQG